MQVLNRSQVLHEPSHDGVAFQKVKDMLACDRQQFLAAEDLLAEQNKIKGWFSGGNIARGLTFVLSLVGVVAAIIFIAYCYKQHKGNKLAAAMTTFALGKLPTAQARPILNHEHAMAARNEFNYRLYLVIAMFVTYMIYRLGKFLFNRYIKYRLVIPKISAQADKYQCHLYIEVLSHTEKVILYLLTIASNTINIEFHKDTWVKIDSLKTSCFDTLLYLKWNCGQFRLLNDTTYDMPLVVTVPFYFRYKVQRMIKGDCCIRLLIYEDVFYQLKTLIRPKTLKSHKERGSKLMIQDLGLLAEDTTAKYASGAVSNALDRVRDIIVPEAAQLLGQQDDQTESCIKIPE